VLFTLGIFDTKIIVDEMVFGFPNPRASKMHWRLSSQTQGDETSLVFVTTNPRPFLMT